MEPEAFARQCEKNYALHRRRIDEDVAKLNRQGVPDKYICIINANRTKPDEARRGTLIDYKDKEDLERALRFVRDCAQLCQSPDVHIFTAVDLRDRRSIRRHIDEPYMGDGFIDAMLCEANSMQ